ncbi:MAG: succinate dehydrogenase cytochrome b subunit [Verrucomicrobiales bacterium]|jgi:succinate dehydrogenase / fumarate reductase cytochrome b subunit|nr:succinate dehydrogenase cytochrome b subunit [Verrucomicrobiales bacterium]
MKALFEVVTSSIGKKLLMGVSGVLLVAFITVHMLGNLQIFLGGHALNQYAHFLKISPELLWGFRLAMAGIIAVHVIVALALTVESFGARPKDYEKERNAASLASRTMIVSGLVILLFVGYHILHFTAHLTNPEFDALLDADSKPDVYRMVIEGFSNPWVSLVYVVGVLLLSWHLSHGVSSMMQSLGLRNRRSACLIDGAAVVFAVVVFVGMASVPAAVYFKLIF